MGIRVDFFIKHVRPYGIDAWQLVCGQEGSGSLKNWLLTNGVPEQQIDLAFNAWANTALLGIDGDSLPQFIAAAQTISQARWNTLYNTDYSTILFLNDSLIKELSYESSYNQNKQFDFDPGEVIPLAVTINRLGQPPTTVENADGATVKADNEGNCFHFVALI